MRIAIVDDERPARSELRHQIQELLKEAEIVEGDSGAAALQIAGDGKYEIDASTCIECGACAGVCPVDAPKPE